MSSLPFLAVRDLRVHLNGRAILKNTQLTLQSGETLALLGASGCGKTTLLRVLAGLIDPVGGAVEGTMRRPALVFQDPRLLPWRSALDNVAVGLMDGNLDRKTQRTRAQEMLTRCGLPKTAWTQKPVQLSGGMRARVACARAFVHQPDLLLLDEPFASLDLGSRMALRDLVGAISKETGAAVLLVTHDLLDAAAMADRIGVMSRTGGRIEIVQERDPSRFKAADSPEERISSTAASLLAHTTVKTALLEPS